MTIIRIIKVINNLDRLIFNADLYMNIEVLQARYVIKDIERAFLVLGRLL